ncbi:MAG: sulfurtransferase TusA family protein [Candidatus Adiutrix sp.]|jgi:TusA-related sulfurtransferase|nr:sulfurtransferase TusA family protein [Candidatus Adiutrix sp.]
MSVKVDARGLSCPQPVMLALKALSAHSEALAVEVDHETAAENVERACREKGRQSRIIKNESGYTVEVSAP